MLVYEKRTGVDGRDFKLARIDALAQSLEIGIVEAIVGKHAHSWFVAGEFHCTKLRLQTRVQFATQR